MKWKYIIPFLLIAIGINTALGQEFDLSFSGPESSTQTHQARNSISLLAGYSYTPGGSGMIAEIINPVVNGSISYAYTPVDPANRSLNTSYLVGATNGAFDVNPAGGASYTIPIDVLPGVNGMAPSLSLVYSSNGGPGMAGYGWQIGGISVVSRSPQTYYHDGTSVGVNLTSTDRFSLDGQRLICITGSYGANNSEYRTEIDNFSKIVCLTDGTSTPKRFLVKTKGGETIEYGYEGDSDQTIDGLTEEVSWYVDKRTDLYGNTIEYEYLKQYGHNYIGEIKYGPNTVTFYYKDRSDKETSYFLGGTLQQNLILDKVEMKYNSTLVKKYELIYNYNNSVYGGTSVLNELVEYGTGSSRLNSTVFSYQTPANVAIAQSTYNTTHSYVTYKSRMCTGDFNGDGKADFLCLPDASKGATWTGIKVCISDGNDNFTNYISSTTTIDLSKLDDMQALDLNGDGKDDFLYELVNSGTSTFYYMLNNGSSFGSPVTINSQVRSANTGMSGKYRRFGNYPQAEMNELSGADYNGDGVNDIFLNSPSGDWRILSLTNSSGQLTSTMYTKGSGNISTLNTRTLNGDFNGDGKADIWSFEAAGMKIYTFSSSTLTQIYTSTWPTKDHHFTLGDFNADGKVDIFLYGYTTYDWGEWQVQISTGTGFEGKMVPKKKNNLKDDYVRLGDFNGDGCTDLLVTSLTQNWTGINFYITKDKGKDFYTHSVYEYNTHNYYLSDFNGDGRTDYICTDGLSPWWNGYQVNKSAGNTTPLLEKVANGLNHLTTIAYTKLSQATTSVYQQGSITPSFPVYNFQGSLPVVSSATMDNGIGSTNSLTYYYEGAKIHRQGKGFLGFSKTIVTDVTAGMLTETQSGYNTTYYYPQVNTVTQKTTGGATIGTTTNTWAQTVLDATTKRIFPYVQSSTQNNVLTGHIITGTTSSVDSYGNPTQTVKTYSNGVSETTVANYTNTINASTWNLGRLDNSTITYSKSGETSVSHTVRYTYFTDGIMKPDLIYYNEGTPLEYFKNHDYNSQGNLTQVYTYGASIGASQVNFTYDTDFVRVKTKTDELGHVTTFNYNSYGQLLTEVDYLNNTNTYAYDALARQTSVSNTNGSQTTTSYVWTGTNKPTLGLYGVTQTGNDGSVSTAWYDKVQRAIRVEKKGFSGTMILIDTEYNAKGQVYRVSDPYFAGGSLVWAETYTTYDNYGRVTGITRNTGRNTTYSYTYGNPIVSETTAGKTFSKTYGADGTLTSATDNGGTINYAYFPDGKAKTITAPGGVVTSMQYADAARNQTQLVDPSAGTITYTYNSRGQIKTQTDARSRLTTYNYLDDGRTNTVVTPEGTTTYTYNTNKQLTGISSPNSVSRTYGYDTKGRATSVGETIAGLTFTTNFTYDTYGRLSTRAHPSTIIETMNYNSYGYMASISAGGATRFTVTGMNAREQLTGATYGSNLSATFGFDAYGYPSSTATGSVQDYRYSFDPVNGNLNWRENFKRSKSESFTYDNLDRLLTATGPQNLTMTYSANGNLNTKSDIGTTAFGYGSSAGPYALTGVTSSTNVIPATSQTATYTSFEKVNTLTEGVYSAAFVYNSDLQRAQMVVAQSGSTILARWYVGSSYMLQIVGGIAKEYTYIGGDAYTAPVAAIKAFGSTTYYYLLRDYLGNITHVYNATTSTAQEYSFDAWGRRRNPTDWSYNLAGQPELFADRGFTGHEYLKYFNLYNMNGRMYDPLVGRFLNVDPYVQMPDFTQNFNRYSYCLNNPLVNSDPSGEFIFTLLAAIIPGAQVFLPYAIAADISWMTDYGMQVAMNYANRKEGTTGSDIWFKNIDWFDVGASAVIGGITGGFSAELKAGKELGKFGTWVVKNRKLITLGEMALTSGIDITGEGFQKVDFGDFSKRMAINGVTFGLNELASNYTKKLVKNPGPESNIDGSKSASTPIGRRGNPLDVKSGTNLPTAIGGRNYTGHALDQMQGRGIMPSVVENAINNSIKTTLGNKAGTFVHFGDGLKVIVNIFGDVVTVIPQ